MRNQSGWAKLFLTICSNSTAIVKTLLYITKGVELGQDRLLQRAIRQNVSLRKHVTREQLTEVLSRYVPASCPTFVPMKQCVELLPHTPVVEDDSNSASGDSSSSSGAAGGGSAAMDVADDEALGPPLLPVAAVAVPPTTVIPEVEVFLFTLVVTTLLRCGLNGEAAFAATALIERIRTFNRRSLDLFSSKAFFYFSLAFERTNKLENVRSTLLALYRTACVRHDETGQAVLLNLLLRSYLHYNLVDQAQTLALRSPFPENVSNNQFCRYLYYMGRVQALQLEYSSSYQRLMVAARKAPQEHALDFTCSVHKLAVLVQLLMGDIPERSLFNQKELRSALVPYLALTQSVRVGDISKFEEVVAKYGAAFKADKNFTLVERLGHNVLKTGLRKLSVSYSRIELADVAGKLHLPSRAAAEYICAKAIRDGVIEASIDHERGVLLSLDAQDVYATKEPQQAFHKRIVFCLDVHNEAVKAMRYPPDAYRKELTAAKDKGEEEVTEEDIRAMQEEDD